MEPRPSSSVAWSDAAPGDPARRSVRAQRVLACWQHALGHDLPNQLVAIQGLLQVLALEERERLSSDGRDYLDRLAALTRKAQEALVTLKAIGRAAIDTGPAEEVALEELVREVAAEVRQLFAHRAITYHLRLGVPAVRAFRRPLHRALVELIRTLLLEHEAAEIHLALESRATADGVELAVARWSSRTETPAASARPVGLEMASVNRLGLALVREIVDTWAGALTVADDAGQGKRYAMLVCPP
jgi:light-regulated signal transduction histidine kinase (bacteriophytochrome)